jgi:hypothetical protein
MNYKKAQRISAEIGEDNDCAVKAVAIACDVPYRMAHSLLKSEGRRNKRGTKTYMIHRAIKGLGFKMTEVEGQAPLKFGGTVTTLTTKVPRTGIYLAYTATHVLIVKNGKVEDWTEGRRHRIQQVYKVERIQRKPRHKSTKAA